MSKNHTKNDGINKTITRVKDITVQTIFFFQMSNLWPIVHRTSTFTTRLGSHQHDCSDILVSTDHCWSISVFCQDNNTLKTGTAKIVLHCYYYLCVSDHIRCLVSVICWHTSPYWTSLQSQSSHFLYVCLAIESRLFFFFLKWEQIAYKRVMNG